MVCDACDIKPMLEYTPDFDKLTCPHCRKQFSFIDVRRRISKEMETHELEMSKERAYVIVNQTQEVELDEADIEVTDYSQQDRTFKFNLGDFITYRNREEAIEMINEREVKKEQTEEIRSFINLDYDPVEEDNDDMLDEIEMMMMRKKGYVPPNKPFMGIPHDDDEPEYDEDQLLAENERLSQLIGKMTDDDEDEEEETTEEFQEASEDEMLEEIENMRKHDEIIYITGNEAEEEDTQTIEEIVTEAVCEVAKDSNIELTPVERALAEPCIVECSKTVMTNINVEVVTETEEVVLPITEVIRKCPGRKVALARLQKLQHVEEEPITLPNEADFNMTLDEAIDNSVWMEPVTEKEDNLKMEIQNLVYKYLTNKGVDFQGLDLDINLDIRMKAEEEHEAEAISVTIGDYEEPYEQTNNDGIIVIGGGTFDDSEGGVVINGGDFEIGGLVDYDQQQQEEIEKMVKLYGATEEDDQGEDLSPEELEALYNNH